MKLTMSSINVSNEELQEESEGSILSFNPAENVNAENEETNSLEDNYIKYENTYRMESKNPFDELKAMALVKTEIKKCLNKSTKYDSYEAAKTCAAISFNVRNGICEMNFERYKIVCIVEIVEKKRQGTLSIVKFLRDIKKDKYIKSEYENNNLFAVVMVAALYYE